MDDATIQLIDLFLSLGGVFVEKLSNKLPAEVLASLQSALAALEAHKNDLVTKANLEAQRG